MRKRNEVLLITLAALLMTTSVYAASQQEEGEEKNTDPQEGFTWWPTDALPGPVRDEERGGYWWWPAQPGKITPWGNRGYIYVYKVIFDYKEEELPPAKPQELRSSLLIKKIVNNVKIYFDYDKAVLRVDAAAILDKAVATLKRNSEASILITGNCDRRGTEAYNEKLGRRRAEVVREFMLDNGIAEERIRIVSRGKLDAVAPVTDLVGMQKDRNAQFMIAVVEEIQLPYPQEVQGGEAQPVEEGKLLIEKEEEVESAIKVSTKEYIVKKGDTLSKIAQEHLGRAHRWKYLYEVNKDRIQNPNKLKPGQKIVIPIE